MDLDDLYQGLTKRVGLSSATVRQIHAIIRRALRQAVLWGWIVNNPAANATPPRQSKTNLFPPNVDQVGELLKFANLQDPEFAHFVHVASTTGARRGELCALRWSNLDTNLKTLTIERSIIEAPGGRLEKDTKTHSNRRIALGSDTLEILKKQRLIAQEPASQICTKVTDDAFMFSREPDGSIPWTPDSVTKRFAIVRDKLGYNNMRFHDLRHFAATRLMAAGVPVRTVSGRLGHANPSTTLSVYSHFVEASDQEAAKVMDSLVSSSSTVSVTKPPSKKTTTRIPR
jgi:integrase